MLIDDDGIEQRRILAREEIAKLCAGEHDWHMSIPVQNSDSDMVLSSAITDSAILHGEVKRLHKAIDRAQTLLAEVNTAFSLSIHERFERTRAAYDVLSEAMIAPAPQRYDGPPPPASPFADEE